MNLMLNSATFGSGSAGLLVHFHGTSICWNSWAVSSSSGLSHGVLQGSRCCLSAAEQVQELLGGHHEAPWQEVGGCPSSRTLAISFIPIVFLFALEHFGLVFYIQNSLILSLILYLPGR